MKKTVVCVVALALCLGSMLSGCTLFDYGDDEPSIVLGTPLAVKYTEYSVIKGDIVKSIVTTCEVKSIEYTTYRFPDSWQGKQFGKFYVKSGDAVKAGDVLCDTADGNTLTSTIDGNVRYLNTLYSNYSKADKTITAGTVIAVVDPETMDKAQGYMTISYDTIGNYTIGVGSTVSMYKSSSYKDKVYFDGTIVGSSLEYLEEEDRHRDRSTESAEFYIDLSNAPEDIKVGDRLSVTYIEDQVTDILMVPVSAVYTYNGRSFVYVLDSQGLKRECYVETGLEGDSFIEIKSGLELGQRIIEY